MKGDRVCRRLWIALALTALCLLQAPPALAAPASGTSLSVPPGVPDQGRAWELVTPPDPISGTLRSVRALSPAGDRISFMSEGLLPGGASGSPFVSANIAVRKPEGWTASPVETPYPGVDSFPALSNPFYFGPDAFSTDLTTSLLQRHLPLQPGQEDADKEIGLFRPLPAGGFALLGSIGHFGVLAGASADLSHVLFASEKHLLPADSGRSEGRSIYELVGSQLRLVDVEDDGATISNCGSYVSAANGYPPEGTPSGPLFPNQISRDGRRIFFASHPSCSGPARVFLREDGTTTTEISASQCHLADCGPEADATFIGATPDGSYAFVVSAQRLTDADTNEHSDLYRYDVASGELELLSSQAGGVDAVATVEPVFSSDDGSRVYFHGFKAGESYGGAPLYYFSFLGDGAQLLGASNFLQASSDGRYALIETPDRLTGSDTDDYPDIYRFDADSGDFVQMSIGVGGGNGPFGATARPGIFVNTTWSHSYRAMSADGSRIFFSTEESLLPQDRNQSVDVYEWTSGALGLISPGVEGSGPATYLGTTPDGQTALFKTSDTLLPRDRDGGEPDFYVARVGGGFSEPPTVPECEGSSCRAVPASPRSDSTPPGLGNGGRLGLGRLSKADRRRIVATGRIELLVEAPRAGLLAAVAKAKLGSRRRPIGSVQTKVGTPGPLRLELPLSRAAGRSLAAGESLQVRLSLSMSGVPKLTTGLELKGSR